MQVEQVANTLYKLTTPLFDQPNSFTVNLTACVGPDGILLVDTAWAETAEKLNETLRELSDGIVKLIIITHPHRDHYGGSKAFTKTATLIAHKTAQDELVGKYFGLSALPGPSLPIISLESELSLRFNGQDITIMPMPGHTSSDVVIHFANAGLACVGDLVFSDSYPGIFPGSGGNVDRYIQSLEELIELFPPGIKLITGHGRDYSLDDLREHHRMAVETSGLIKKGIAEGKTAQDMVEQDMLKDWAKWSHPPVISEEWITHAYENLTGQAKKSISDPLSYTIMESGVQAAIEQYHELESTQPEAYDWAENHLNMLGYQLLWRAMPEAAIEVLKLNAQVYPQSANCYDSLGEVYMASGNHALAIESYQHALALNPELPSALDALKKLAG
jgi:cyclase